MADRPREKTSLPINLVVRTPEVDRKSQVGLSAGSFRPGIGSHVLPTEHLGSGFIELIRATNGFKPRQ